MKKLLLFILMLLPMLANAQAVSDIQDSGCLNEHAGLEAQKIVLTKEGSTLSVQLLNYIENCCTEDFNATSSISGGSNGELCSVSINVAPAVEWECTCYCPFNVSFTVRDLEPNSFYFNCLWCNRKVELKEGEPLEITFHEETGKMEINETRFPDLAFRIWLLGQEYGKDGILTKEEIAEVTTMNLFPQNITAEGQIKSLKGIEYFTAMTKLICSKNELTELDLSKNTALTWLECYGNHLTELDLSNNTELTYLDCGGNELTSLDVSGCTGLTELDCSSNQLKTLNASGCRALTFVKCHNNQLTQLDASNNKMLTTLWTYHNPIKREAIDALIESLPIVSRGDWCCVESENDESVVTTTQVAAAKTKGWTSYYWNESAKSWMEYAGSETTINAYRPFVEEGKVWNVIISDFGGDYHFDYYMMTNEEVVKAGKTYTKMHWSEDEDYLLREEDRKVYIFDSDKQKEFLLFDYSLKAGDTFDAYSYEDQKMVSYKVLSVGDCTEGPQVIYYNYDEQADDMVTQHRYLRKWVVCRTDNSLQHTWIESVGSLEGPLANLSDSRPISSRYNLAYVEYKDGDYLPFSFNNEIGHHGCNLPIGTKTSDEYDSHHKLTYELDGNRLHVYGEVFTQCGPNNYAYFHEKKTDDPLVNKIEFVIQEAEPMEDCMALHATDFYVPGFDPNMNYIVVDNYGEEHPVIYKTPQIVYRPFIENDKVWTVKVISDWWPTEEWLEYYYFDGDTIVNGQSAKRMLCDKIDSSQDKSGEYIGAWFEQNKKVYFATAGKQQFELLYDFTLSTGDNIHNQDGILQVTKMSGSIQGFKGTYYDLLYSYDTNIVDRWLEGIGSESYPWLNLRGEWAGNRGDLLVCRVGDEIIYYNSEEEDPYSMGAKKHRFDFTHTVKNQPKAPRRSREALSLYGEYNERQLGINLDPLGDAYQVSITDESGKVVYEKAVNAGSVVALDIDISAYVNGRYTVTVENSNESFTGEFDTQTTGIKEVNSDVTKAVRYYSIDGKRISTLQRGLNIIRTSDGKTKKVVVK